MDFKKMSVRQIEQLEAQLAEAKKDRQKQEREEALDAVRSVLKERGFTIADLGLSGEPGSTRAASTSGGPRTKGEPKYRNPDNPDQTWTGKGRRPAWLLEAQERGAALEDLAI